MADGLMNNPYAGLLNMGLSPEQAQAQIDEQRAMQFANMNPQQRIASGIYKGVTGIGRALGAKDPLLEQASQMRALAQQFDTTTAEGLMQYAQALQQSGNIQAAQAAAMQARQVQTQEAKLGSEQALTQQRLRERAAADPIEQFIRANASKFTPASLEKYRQTRKESDLEPFITPEKPKRSAFAQMLIERGLEEGSPEFQAAMAKYTESKGKNPIEEAMAAFIKVQTAGQKKEAEETGQFAAKDFNALGSAVAAGTASKRNITVLDNALKNAFTGSFADTKTGIIKGFDALGVPVNQELRQAASNTELINAMGTRYVFPLVKNFPGSLAAKELDRLEKTSPNALQQPETIRSLVDLLKVDLAENEFTYNKAKAYKDSNKGSAIGFNQADAKIEFQNKLTTLRQKVAAAKSKGSVTAEEKKEIEALKSELGVQ